MAWLSSDPCKAHVERIFLIYSPLWMCVVASVVFFGWYEHFTAEHYMLLGLGVAVPCLVLPFLFPCEKEKNIPFYERLGFRVNAWVAIQAFVGNHFITHYFYNVLGMRYTVPTGPYSLNAVPVCMFLMTQPYFCSYHVLATVVMRRLGLLSDKTSFATRASAVLALAYFTAFMETWSISAFPHYTYPDQHLMFTVGSAFYALFFVVTYNTFPWMDETTAWPLRRTLENSLASAMMVMILMDAWRLLLGPLPGGSSAAVPYA